MPSVEDEVRLTVKYSDGTGVITWSKSGRANKTAYYDENGVMYCYVDGPSLAVPVSKLISVERIVEGTHA
jgi:hypothetical protein